MHTHINFVVVNRAVIHIHVHVHVQCIYNVQTATIPVRETLYVSLSSRMKAEREQLEMAYLDLQEKCRPFQV